MASPSTASFEQGHSRGSYPRLAAPIGRACAILTSWYLYRSRNFTLFAIGEINGGFSQKRFSTTRTVYNVNSGVSTFSPAENSSRFPRGLIGGGSLGGVQVLFPGSSARVKPTRPSPQRDASRRRVSRVSGANVGVRDARYFKFHPGHGALSLRPILSPPPFRSFSTIVSLLPSFVITSPSISCCHLIPEIRTSAGRANGSLALQLLILLKLLWNVRYRVFAAIKAPFTFLL